MHSSHLPCIRTKRVLYEYMWFDISSSSSTHIAGGGLSITGETSVAALGAGSVGRHITQIGGSEGSNVRAGHFGDVFAIVHVLRNRNRNEYFWFEGLKQ
jgi:hypothetical protein